MNKLIYLAICSFAVASFACSETNSQTSNSANILMTQSSETANSNKIIKSVNAEVKALYIAEPTDKGDVSRYGSSKILIFYKNGEFGKMWIGLLTDNRQKTGLRAFFDEVVQHGSWKEENGKVKITIQNCRCLHCDEDHDEKITKKQMQDPVPFTEYLKIEKGNLGDAESVLSKSNKKSQFIKEDEFDFVNYDEMIAEPLAVKNNDADGKCIAYDLKDFN